MKHVARIFSLIIAVICALAVISYIFKPFASIDLGFTITATKMEELLGDELGDDVDIDFEKDIGDTDVQLEIIIPSSLLLTAWQAQDNTYVREQLIAQNIEKILTTLKPKIDALAEKAVKSVAKGTLKGQLKEQMKSTLGTEDNAQIEKYLEDANIDDEYLSTKVDEVFDALSQENATVDTVTETIVDSVNDMISKLKESDSDTFGSMTELDETAKAELTTSLTSSLKELGIADEDGNIQDISEATSALLATLLQQLDSKDETSDEGNSGIILCGEEEEAEEKADELYTLLYNKINSLITDEIVNTIAKVLKVVAIVVAVEIFFWAFQIVKIVFKLFAKVPAIKVWCPIWFGWLPELLLGYIPSLLLLLLSKGTLNSIPFISSALGIFDAFGGIGAISLKIVTSAHLPSILALVLVVISIPNSIIRNKIKNSL